MNAVLLLLLWSWLRTLRPTDSECKWDQARDVGFLSCLHFCQHLKTDGKTETLVLELLPHCPPPKPPNWEGKKKRYRTHEEVMHVGTPTCRDMIERKMNTWCHRFLLVGCLCDCPAEWRADGSAWWGPDQLVRERGSWVGRQGGGRPCGNGVEGCRLQEDPQCPINYHQYPCCHLSHHLLWT